MEGDPLLSFCAELWQERPPGFTETADTHSLDEDACGTLLLGTGSGGENYPETSWRCFDSSHEAACSRYAPCSRGDECESCGQSLALRHCLTTMYPPPRARRPPRAVARPHLQPAKKAVWSLWVIRHVCSDAPAVRLAFGSVSFPSVSNQRSGGRCRYHGEKVATHSHHTSHSLHRRARGTGTLRTPRTVGGIAHAPCCLLCLCLLSLCFLPSIRAFPSSGCAERSCCGASSSDLGSGRTWTCAGARSFCATACFCLANPSLSKRLALTIHECFPRRQLAALVEARGPDDDAAARLAGALRSRRVAELRKHNILCAERSTGQAAATSIAPVALLTQTAPASSLLSHRCLCREWGYKSDLWKLRGDSRRKAACAHSSRARRAVGSPVGPIEMLPTAAAVEIGQSAALVAAVRADPRIPSAKAGYLVPAALPHLLKRHPPLHFFSLTSRCQRLPSALRCPSPPTLFECKFCLDCTQSQRTASGAARGVFQSLAVELSPALLS